ncbi:hypothetical protein BKA62DRAFT_705245 [Auriculariales sp. MPI-PUGE-AT-0066]|nr:hypothetical protein BKA62DRAFT_705245 [Auriculariales sp. MPI-PUGE-AT-0066]
MKLYDHMMPVRRSIYPVLDSRPLVSSIRRFLELVEGVHSPDNDFDERLDRCFVTSISHYRAKRSDQEAIILRMEYSEMDVGVETRFYRLERFRANQSKKARSSNWLQQSLSQPSLMPNSGLDALQISDQLGLLTKHDSLVREFSVTRGIMTILEAVVFADTLSELCIRYTEVIQMCQFWAINLFLALKATVTYRGQRDVLIHEGSGVRTAGTHRGLRLVNVDTGRATTELLYATETELKRMFSTSRNRDWKRTAAQARKDSLSLINVASGGIINTVTTPEFNPTDDLTSQVIFDVAQKSLHRLRSAIREQCAAKIAAEAKIFKGQLQLEVRERSGFGSRDSLTTIWSAPTNRSIVSPDWTPQMHTQTSSELSSVDNLLDLNLISGRWGYSTTTLESQWSGPTNRSLISPTWTPLVQTESLPPEYTPEASIYANQCALPSSCAEEVSALDHSLPINKRVDSGIELSK